MNRNPSLKVKLVLPKGLVASSRTLVWILCKANILEIDGNDAFTMYLHPPKGTVNNEFWASRVVYAATEFNIPALIVRN